MGTLSGEKGYSDFLTDIKERIRQSQYAALRAVNKELIAPYWGIGNKIVEKQAKFGWGKSIVETLAADLQKEYPGIRGFSAQNLWAVRKFCILYEEDAKLQRLVGEIGWGANLIIMSRLIGERAGPSYVSPSRCRR